jgi:hypothetical protein
VIHPVLGRIPTLPLFAFLVVIATIVVAVVVVTPRRRGHLAPHDVRWNPVPVLRKRGARDERRDGQC